MALRRTSAADREGGLKVWSPAVVPWLEHELTDEQALACAFRILAGEGFVENLAGHISWQRPGTETILINPWGLWWREIASSDVCEVDANARVIRGKWDVTPAIHIHTELHRLRDDARVIIHNHPYYVTVLAALGALPDLIHQTGSLFLDDVKVIQEYDGEIDSAELGADLAKKIGDAPLAILANHGVIVTGANLAEATYRAASIDRVCRLSYDVMLTGQEPLKMSRGLMVGIKASLLERAADVYWGGAVRGIIQDQPDVLQ